MEAGLIDIVRKNMLRNSQHNENNFARKNGNYSASGWDDFDVLDLLLVTAFKGQFTRFLPPNFFLMNKPCRAP